MTSYRLIGSATTDSNGVATYNYTGVGAGKLQLIASTDSTITSSSLLSEIYEVLDCTKYDKGIASDYNDIWSTNTTSSTISVTRDTDYTEFAEVTIGTNFTNAVTGLSDECIVEFDYYQVDGLASNSFISIQDSSNASVYTGGVNLGMLNGTVGDWYHLKLTFSNGTLTILNETNQATATKTLTSTPFKFNFWSSNNITTIRFRNFKIYPI